MLAVQKTCAAYKPVDKATANTANEMPVFLVNALFKEDNITKPESQKTGIEIINPIIFIASGDLFELTLLSIFSAINLVPPLFSRKIPMVVPKAIINPILDKVFPKPSVIDLMISSVSNPNKNPTMMDAIMSEKTGCTLYLIVTKTIKNKIIESISNVCINF